MVRRKNRTLTKQKKQTSHNDHDRQHQAFPAQTARRNKRNDRSDTIQIRRLLHYLTHRGLHRMPCFPFFSRPTITRTHLLARIEGNCADLTNLARVRLPGNGVRHMHASQGHRNLLWYRRIPLPAVFSPSSVTAAAARQCVGLALAAASTCSCSCRRVDSVARNATANVCYV